MITVVGSLNMDLVMHTDKLPRSGETVMGHSFKQVPGGKGGNQADAVAKLGADVKMIGCVGDDSMGTILKDSLKRDGVNVDYVLVKPKASTGVAAIIVEASGNNTITVAPGANYELITQDIADLNHIITTSDAILLQLEIPLETVIVCLKLAKATGQITILNPAPAIDLNSEILKCTDVLTPNETELEILSGHRTDTLENIKIAGKVLLDKGVKELVVTLGEKGCIYMRDDIFKYYQAYKVKAVDTTAAGDSFNAALAVSLSNGKTMDDAIIFAMKVGAMTVTKEGAQTSLPLFNEVLDFDQWYRLQNDTKEVNI